MELKDTIALMTSSDYKQRFVAEYYQTKIRYEKLNAMIDKFYKNQLDFTPTCPIFVLKLQRDTMLQYLAMLEKRAAYEEIKLEVEL